MSDARETEYDAFTALLHHLAEAERCINVIGALREDRNWAKMAANVALMRETLMKLAGSGATKT